MKTFIFLGGSYASDNKLSDLASPDISINMCLTIIPCKQCEINNSESDSFSVTLLHALFSQRNRSWKLTMKKLLRTTM